MKIIIISGLLMLTVGIILRRIALKDELNDFNKATKDAEEENSKCTNNVVEFKDYVKEDYIQTTSDENVVDNKENENTAEEENTDNKDKE